MLDKNRFCKKLTVCTVFHSEVFLMTMITILKHGFNRPISDCRSCFVWYFCTRSRVVIFAEAKWICSYAGTEKEETWVQEAPHLNINYLSLTVLDYPLVIVFPHFLCMIVFIQYKYIFQIDLVCAVLNWSAKSRMPWNAVWSVFFSAVIRIIRTFMHNYSAKSPISEH